MAEIQLSELRPAGFELFQGSESYICDLKEKELGTVVGGFEFAANVHIQAFVNDDILGPSEFLCFLEADTGADLAACLNSFVD